MTLSSGHYLSYVHVQPQLTPKKQLFSPNFSQKVKLENHWKDCDDPEVTFKSSTIANGEISDIGVHTAKTEMSDVDESSCADQWVECDDESIRVYSEDEFAGILSGEEGSLLGTPYVLFYHRIS